MQDAFNQLSEVERLSRDVKIVIQKQDILDNRLGSLEVRQAVLEEKVETDRLIQKEETEMLKQKVDELKEEKLKDCKYSVYRAICFGLLLILLLKFIGL